MHRREAIAALLASPILAIKHLQAQPDLTALTIAEASSRLASQSITPLQLTEAYLRRIAQTNKTINAYITVTAELARREAKMLDDDPKGPMWGIPIAHKDLFETKGVRTTAGSRLFDQNVPGDNAAIVQHFEDAGAVMLGKTNTHELGGGVTTINPFYGTTRNPIDESRIAGGSKRDQPRPSSRISARRQRAATPAAACAFPRPCGCVGFKPTHGKFSTPGLIAASPTFDHVGFLTRTVEDMQIFTGRPAGKPAPLRGIAVARNYFFDGLDPAVASAMNTVLPAKFPSIDFPIDSKTMSRIFDPVFSFEMWGRFGADWRTDPGSFSREMAAFFSTPRPSIAEYEAGLAALKEYQSAVDRLFDSVDVIITPTVPVVAPPIAGPIDGMKILRNCWPFNAAGTPAISIPLEGGTSVPPRLPVGLQLIAKRGEDDKLLQFARTFVGP
jgi:aspartyl-tRNA(Asn)/glutamyl-tRNA(Gln) amidotransferase subunit A